MKKMYIQPNVEAADMQPQSIICASDVVNNNALPGGDGGEQLPPVAD